MQLDISYPKYAVHNIPLREWTRLSEGDDEQDGDDEQEGVTETMNKTGWRRQLTWRGDGDDEQD